MSTSERVNKQIKALAANSKFLTSIIKENEIDQIQKRVDLIKSETSFLPEPNSLSTSSSSSSTQNYLQYNSMPSRETLIYSDKEICFDSMLQLTNFILYNDYPNETDCITKRKYLQTSRCDYNLTKTDLKEIDFFAKELDMIETELADIHADIKTYKKSYLIYCENLMRFIDQKEIMMNLFLNYYDEYFLQRRIKIVQKSEKQSNLNLNVNLNLNGSTKSRRKSINQNSSTNNLNNKDKYSSTNMINHRPSLQLNNSGPPVSMFNNTVNRRLMSESNGYISDDSSFGKSFQNSKRKMRGALSTTVYSVPTENRFACLSRNQLNNIKSNNKTKS